jgi:hypothetical protein
VSGAEPDGAGRGGSAIRVPILLALTAGPAAAEAAILNWAGVGSARGLAPQAGAPGPFGVFHDLRWVFVYHDSWPAFATEVLAAIAVRTLLTVAIVVAAWPAGQPRPSVGRLTGTGLAVTAVTAVALAPWTAITVAAGVTALSWFSVGALLAVLALALVLQRGPMTGVWWRGLPPLAAVGWIVVTFPTLTLGALVVNLAAGWAVVPVAAAAGAANALLWRGLIRATVVARPHASRLPAVPVVVVLLVLALAASGQLARSGSRVAARPPPPIVLRDGARVPEQALVYVGGYDSQYDGRTMYGPDPAGRVVLPVLRFSYQGIDGWGRPLPYSAASTHQSLARSASLLATQVADVRLRTGRSVALLGHSEGSLVVRTYLNTNPHPDLDTVVLLSPLPQPGRVYYPPPDTGAGWGIATGWQLRVIFAVVDRIGGSGLSTDAPFIRSLLDDGPRYHDRMLCPVPGLRMIAFLPIVDAIADPPGPEPAIPVVVVPERHAMDYGRAETQRRLIAFLNGEPPTPTPMGLYRAVRAAAAGWQAPSLSPGLNSAWNARRADTASRISGCSAGPGR